MAHETFVHDIGNKPAPDVPLEQWWVALLDADGGDLAAGRAPWSPPAKDVSISLLPLLVQPFMPGVHAFPGAESDQWHHGPCWRARSCFVEAFSASRSSLRKTSFMSCTQPETSPWRISSVLSTRVSNFR